MLNRRFFLTILIFCIFCIPHNGYADLRKNVIVNVNVKNHWGANQQNIAVRIIINVASYETQTYWDPECSCYRTSEVNTWSDNFDQILYTNSSGNINLNQMFQNTETMRVNKIKVSLPNNPEGYPENYETSDCFDFNANFKFSFLLNNEQRRIFLHYYSPLILKRADEAPVYGESRKGLDWITNWWFDDYLSKNNGTYSDDDFNNNAIWAEKIFDYANWHYAPSWKIRPTLYTSIVEFMDENDQKCLKLIYHIYHAIDKKKNDQYKLHDWERVEILLKNVSQFPGNSESIEYVVITSHHDDNTLMGNDTKLSFHQSSLGKHVMIWQSQWSTGSGTVDELGGQELQFVSNGSSLMNMTNDDWATVNLVESTFDSTGQQLTPYPNVNFHYLFLNEMDYELVNYWKANKINNINAHHLASGKGKADIVKLKSVKRICYELQDIADIIPSMDETYDWNKLDLELIHRHLTIDWWAYWLENGQIKSYSGDPILDDLNNIVMPVPTDGDKKFYTIASNDPDERSGYLAKHWFWGTFFSDFDLYLRGSYVQTGVSLHQHQYWLGYPIFQGPEVKKLPTPWFLQRYGGFDGRWVQLFSDIESNYTNEHVLIYDVMYWPLNTSNSTVSLNANKTIEIGQTTIAGLGEYGIINVEFYAGNSIAFKPGFSVSGGSTLRASIIEVAQSNSFSINNWSPMSAMAKSSESESDLKKDAAADSVKTEIPTKPLELPTTFSLDQNYPNPFNPTTTMRYALKEDVAVTLKIYNMLGQEVKALVNNQKQTAGFKSVMWDGRNNYGHQVPSGTYIYRLQAGTFIQTRKMLLVK